MKKNYDRLREAYEYATSEQEMWYVRYKSCYQYAMPNRDNYWQMQPGQKKDYYLFDSTAVLATRAFVAKTQDAITPCGVNWCTLKSGSLISDEDKEQVDMQLQKLTSVLFDNLRKSNFDTTAAESYFDVAAGTAAIYIKDMPGEDCPFWFESVSQYLISAFENSHGILTNVFRYYRFMRNYQLPTRFPHVKFPKYVLENIKKAPYEMFQLVDAWIDNEDGTFTNYLGNEGLSEIYFESTPQESSPWIVYRWSKLPGESYGRGPLLDVIGDIKTANCMMERYIKQADLLVDPPYVYYADYINPNNIRLQPGAIIPARAMGGALRPLEPLFTPGDFQLGQWGFEKWWQNINSALFANPIGSMTDPTKSATEIQYRRELYAQEVGPALGRLQQEYLNPLTKRLIYILIKVGKFPRDAFPDNNWTSISYVSPLIQNQQTEDLRNITRFVQAIDEAGGPQTAMSVLNIPSAVSKFAELTNIPLEIVKTGAEIQQMMQQQAQQAAQQQQQEQMQQQSSPNIPQGPSVLPGAQ